MTATEVYFYIDRRGRSPVDEWLESLARHDPRGHRRCYVLLHMLEEQGLDLRRPYSDLLEEGIHELRVKSGRIQYRLLYYFKDREVAIVAVGTSKEGAVPKAEITRAKERRAELEATGSHPTRLSRFQGVGS